MSTRSIRSVVSMSVTKPSSSRKPTARRPRAARSASFCDDACNTMRSSGSRTNPARVANEAPSTGTLIAPCTCPAPNRSADRTSKTVALQQSVTWRSGGGASTHGPLFSATTRAVVGGRGVADEQGVTGQHYFLVHDECAVLRSMTRGVEDADRDVSDTQLLSVLERIVRELGLRESMDGDRHAVLERESSVPGHVIGVRMRLEHACDAKAFARGRLQIWLDLVRRVDDRRLACPGVPDQIGGAAEIVVD